jgi:hypothetical protein
MPTISRQPTPSPPLPFLVKLARSFIVPYACYSVFFALIAVFAKFQGGSGMNPAMFVLGIALVPALISLALYKFSRFAANKPLGTVAKTFAWIFVPMAAVLGVILFFHFLRIFLAMILVVDRGLQAWAR